MVKRAKSLAMVGGLKARPRLAGAIAAGVAVGLACAALGLRAGPCAILGWDATCLTFIALGLASMSGRKPADIRKVADRQDEGRGFILALVTFAAAASLFAVGLELSQAHKEHGLAQGLHVTMAFVTVALSWFMVQLIYALHYAHEYYSAGDDPGAAKVAGGLAFPGKEPPDYWDFLHFAIVIGAASQTADIAFTSKAVRRVGTFHTVLSFVFNTVVVALTINLLASLF